MDVELTLQYLPSQMYIEQINIFVTLSTTDNLIQSVSKETQLKSEQFILYLFKYGFQIRIVHGWDCDYIEPLDILKIKVLDPSISFSLFKEKKHSQVDFSPYFYEESHNDIELLVFTIFLLIISLLYNELNIKKQKNFSSFFFFILLINYLNILKII